MRILVTGANGMLGSALVPELLKNGHDIVATDIELRDRRPWGPDGPTLAGLDVRSAADIGDAMHVVRPELVVHLAAETSLEVCELDPDNAVMTNALGTKFIALACQAAQVPLAYVSTAGVFDGRKESPYDEFDPPNPINVYGRTKLSGEHYVETLLDRHYVVRAGWMIGGGQRRDHKFVSRILEQLDAGARGLFAVGDRLGTPTYVRDFARNFSRLIVSGSYGRYHMAGTGEGSRYDVARRILEILGRDDVELVEVDSSYFAKEYWVARPRSEIMRNLVLELQGMNDMRPWDVALEDYLRSHYHRWFAQQPARELETVGT